MTPYISNLLQISLHEKSSYAHFLIAGVCIVIYIIIKVTGKSGENQSQNIPVDFSAKTDLRNC